MLPLSLEGSIEGLYLGSIGLLEMGPPFQKLSSRERRAILSLLQSPVLQALA
jgi:hypothetical protein